MQNEPMMDLCGYGHKFYKTEDHPKRDGIPRCPHCMAIGLDRARAEIIEMATKFYNWERLSSAEVKALWNATKKPTEFAAQIDAKLRQKNRGGEESQVV